jgi:hypothetical protein
MNIQQPTRIIKQHELDRPTLEWCPVCGNWITISVQVFHICRPSITKPVKPWKEIK